MADAKISALSADASVTGTEQVPVNDGGTTKRVTTQQISDLGIGVFQPIDSDLTAIAALTTTSFGRGLLALADGAALTKSLTLVGAKAYATATQSISATTETAVTYDTEEFDTDSFHSNVSNTSRFTIPTGLGGKYLLQVGGTIPNIGTSIDFKINGTTYLRGTGSGTAAGNRNSTVGIAVLAQGDYVEAIVYAPSGTTIGHASAQQEQMTMSVVYLGA
jgi:hypothetical protein